jgi:hypothetical protein
MPSRLRLHVLSLAAFLLLGAAGDRLRADEKAEAPEKAPKISVEPASFDFGKALQAKTLEKQFSIRNYGDADLVIAQITTTCGCTAALLDDSQKVIKPGASGQLRVRLETRDYSGRVVRSVLVRSNDPAKNVLEVKVEATVQAAAK